MTVKELIKELQELEQDLDVVLDHDFYGWLDLENINIMQPTSGDDHAMVMLT